VTDSDPLRNLSELLAEARARQKLISDNLPEGVDPQALTWSSKTPYVAMCFREAQFCRAEQFARAAYEMFERDDVVVGISNTRSVIESVAAIWFLNEKIEKQLKNGPQPDIHEQMVQLVMGFKNDPGFPAAINVLTMIDRCDATFSGFRKSYDRMSEFAHPNYSGALGTFGARDPDVAITWFKKGSRNVDSAKKVGLINLIAGLKILEFAYNRTHDLMGPFCKLFDEEQAKAQQQTAPS
jgi:hypothetical protein